MHVHHGRTGLGAGNHLLGDRLRRERVSIAGPRTDRSH